jgi:hypothetical protein
MYQKNWQLKDRRFPIVHVRKRLRMCLREPAIKIEILYKYINLIQDFYGASVFTPAEKKVLKDHALFFL